MAARMGDLAVAADRTIPAAAVMESFMAASRIAPSVHSELVCELYRMTETDRSGVPVIDTMQAKMIAQWIWYNMPPLTVAIVPPTNDAYSMLVAMQGLRLSPSSRKGGSANRSWTNCSRRPPARRQEET